MAMLYSYVATYIASYVDFTFIRSSDQLLLVNDLNVNYEKEVYKSKRSFPPQANCIS